MASFGKGRKRQLDKQICGHKHAEKDIFICTIHSFMHDQYNRWKYLPSIWTIIHENWGSYLQQKKILPITLWTDFKEAQHVIGYFFESTLYMKNTFKSLYLAGKFTPELKPSKGFFLKPKKCDFAFKDKKFNDLYLYFHLLSSYSFSALQNTKFTIYSVV